MSQKEQILAKVQVLFLELVEQAEDGEIIEPYHSAVYVAAQRILTSNEVTQDGLVALLDLHAQWQAAVDGYNQGWKAKGLDTAENIKEVLARRAAAKADRSKQP